MPKQSKAGKMIRRSAGDGPATTALDLQRLRETMHRRAVRTDDIPELKGTEPPVHRDTSGNLPVEAAGTGAQAILESLDDHKMTRYQLRKKARTIAVRCRGRQSTNTSRGAPGHRG